MREVTRKSPCRFELNGAQFPDRLQEFSDRSTVQPRGEWQEVVFPWPVCIDDIIGVGAIEVQTCLEGTWGRYDRPSDEVRGGASPKSPLVATALRTHDAAQLRIILDSEVFAVSDFSDRWGLHLEKLIAGQPAFQRFQGHRIINASPDASFSALAISRPNGQFGNNFKQIQHAIALSSIFGSKRIYLPNKLSQFSVPHGRMTIGDMEFVAFDDRSEIDESALFGTFFYKDSFHGRLQIGATGQQRIVNQYIAALFTPLSKARKLPDNHIAIHIRSNDLFNRPNPHPRYPQPPLAFYKKVIDHFGCEQPQMHVTLVYQDKANPVIDAVEAYLLQRGVSFESHSGSLSDDLAVLLSHATLVFGRGTFGKAVTSLAPHVRRLYFPWTDSDFGFLLRAKRIDGFRVLETTPMHIPIGEWNNSPKQRQLMIDYPIENLTLNRFQV